MRWHGLAQIMSQTRHFQGCGDNIGPRGAPRRERRVERGPILGNRAALASFGLSQIAAEALDAAAGLFEVLGLGRVGDAERRPEAERRTLHHRNAFGLEQLGDEILIVAELLAVRRSLADRAGAGRIDVERALGARALDAVRLVEHRDAEVAPFLEDLVVLRDEI